MNESRPDDTPITGAESLLRTLVASGVEVCFANPGTSEMHFVSAIDRVGGGNEEPIRQDSRLPIRVGDQYVIEPVRLPFELKPSQNPRSIEHLVGLRLKLTEPLRTA